MNGYLVLDKPAGPTSFACVSRVRRLLGGGRVGHTGTLDPQAVGVLILLIGPATRLQEKFLELPKQYAWIAELGRKTSTGDNEGVEIETKSWSGIDREKLEAACRSFVGPILQTPPIYSALKFKGKPYYDYARKGQEVPRTPRPVTIYSLDLLSVGLPQWEARAVCSRGTYIRTLVEDIAERAGTVGTLIKLVRESVGQFTQANALPWSVIEEGNAEKIKAAIHTPPREMLESVHA